MQSSKSPSLMSARSRAHSSNSRFSLFRFFFALCFACGLFQANGFAAPFSSATTSVTGTTYYLAPAGDGGRDSNSGLSASSPWLTPNHSMKCGDVVMAAASSNYDSENFNSGKWGNVACSGANNVAWLQCTKFDACKIYSTKEGIYVDHSFWGVTGWEVTVAPGAPGFCFATAPNYSNPTQIHHVIIANNIANGCQAGGFSTFNVGTKASVDYVAVIGNIVYNSIQGAAECYNGISIYQPMRSDAVSGTHIYIAGNFAWDNVQHNPCGGVQAWGGDGIILDTFDGTNSGITPYTAQSLVDNNIVISNGGHGIEVQNNVAGSSHGMIYLRHNTSWGNETDRSQQVNHLCAEILINSGYSIQEEYNLVATSGTTACSSNPVYALSGYTMNGSVWIYNNFAFGSNNQNSYAYNYGTFRYDTNNTFGVNPYFKGSFAPGAPSCGATASVPACMATVVSDFVATNSAASGMGYQKPSAAGGHDALFPQWVCSVNLPAGLVTKGC